MAREMKKELPKLLLWHTSDCKPLFTHNHLLPIMEKLGFVALPLSPTKITKFHDIEVRWMEYKYCGASAITTKTGPFRSNPLLTIQTPPPTPKLPYPYIDGLHLYTYKTFLEAVNFYLVNRCSRNIFHVQGIPARLGYPELDHWDYSHESKTIFRGGTLDPALKGLYSNDIPVEMMPFEMFPAKEDFHAHDDPEITMAPIDDIIVTDHH